MIFNTSNKIGADNAWNEFNRLVKIGSIIEIKQVRKNRTSLQNRALHLFFTQVSDQLNESGMPFIYRGIEGEEIEMRWTAELFKDFTWRPIQKTMFGTESTTKLKTDQVDKIFEVINKFFADKGITVTFPNRFDYYLKFYDNEIK